MFFTRVFIHQLSSYQYNIDLLFWQINQIEKTLHLAIFYRYVDKVNS